MGHFHETLSFYLCFLRTPSRYTIFRYFDTLPARLLFLPAFTSFLPLFCVRLHHPLRLIHTSAINLSGDWKTVPWGISLTGPHSYCLRTHVTNTISFLSGTFSRLPLKVHTVSLGLRPQTYTIAATISYIPAAYTCIFSPATMEVSHFRTVPEKTTRIL